MDWLSFKGYPISRAEKLIEHNLDEIAEIIEDIDQYPTVFKRVTETKRLDSNIVHVMLDMPFPFSGRDYVIKYSSEKDENIWKFSFYAVDHPKGTLKPGVVRLDNAAGIWILKGLPNNKTMVTYAWHGELLGNFPDFGLNKAWITQGTEVLTWLDKALSI
ncbi:MAG: hypothetical protein CM15mP64_2670 [Candidatus Neomarinimicrobiota bacterium]|nr:MAG: hypothetical protein CM15mP64_2670 [Candidatus Neomarinimicrobiota bacterium]